LTARYPELAVRAAARASRYLHAQRDLACGIRVKRSAVG